LFPFVPAEIPEDKDPYRHIACHCALGTMAQILQGRGVDLAVALPAVRPWMLRYQLPDGGMNCDESAYLRPVPHSSLVSTLPPAEWMLTATDPASCRFADQAARYLLARRLNRSVSQGMRPIDEAWWTPTFPRFYEYDVLRGLEYVTAWAERRGTSVPSAALQEPLDRLGAWFELGPERAVARHGFDQAQTIRPAPNGTWGAWEPVASFPLLELAARPDVAFEQLFSRWRRVLDRL
jgi:hypothetical protein